MALTDSGASAESVSGLGAPIRLTAGAAWVKGDLIGAGSTGWVPVDTDASEIINPKFIAGRSAASGDIGVPVYEAAIVKGGRYSGGSVNAAVYASTTGGRISETPSAFPVGFLITADTAYLNPDHGPRVTVT